MPRNGSGVFSLPSGNPVVTGTTIQSSWANDTLSDMATALTGSVAADGQTPMAGNLPMGGNRITGLAAAGALTDGTTAGDVQSGKLAYLTAVAGVNTITASLSYLAAYAAGNTFGFIAAADNAGSVTLNINGLGAKAVTRNGTIALVAGDILSGQLTEVQYDGTQFQLVTQPATGRFIGRQVFTATGTYTPSTGTRSVEVEVQGGGGGSGGCAVTSAGNWCAGMPGAGGGYGRKRITSAFSGVTVTVGAGGTGGASGVAGTGGTGGTSSFGALISCTGGGGGQGSGASQAGASVTINPSAAGGTATGADYSVPGECGPATICPNVGAFRTARGGASFLGPGGIDQAVITSAVAGSSPAGGYGGGASPPGNGNASLGATAGSVGAPGIVIVWEYA